MIAAAHAARSPRSRCGPGRNRDRCTPARGNPASRREKVAPHRHGRNDCSRHASANGVDARHRRCDTAPAIVPLHGVGHGAEAKLAGDGSAPCLPSDPGRFLPRQRGIPGAKIRRRTTAWIAQVGPQAPPAPCASLRAKGAPLRGRGPPMDYLDNPRPDPASQPIRRFFSKKLRIQAGIDTA